MIDKCRPLLRQKTLENVKKSILMQADKNCIQAVFERFEEQQAEIARFKNRQKPTVASGYKLENGKVVFYTNMLGGCRIEKENLEEVVKTLNELLQEAYAKDEIAFALKCKTEELKTAKAEAVKEFSDTLHDEVFIMSRTPAGDIDFNDFEVVLRKVQKEMVG